MHSSEPEWAYVTASMNGRRATIRSWHDRREDADAEAVARERLTGQEHTSIPQPAYRAVQPLRP